MCAMSECSNSRLLSCAAVHAAWLLGLCMAAGAALAGGGVGPAVCDCLWNNGSPPSPLPVNTPAVVSHEGGLIPLGIKVADDFYLQPGSIYRLDSISAEMLTNSLPGFAKARLELYSDCDGHPGQLLYIFTRPRVVEGPASGIDDLRRVTFTFVASEQGGPGTVSPPIALRDGAYWVSVVGLSDNLCAMGMCDQTAWLPTDGPVKGRPPRKILGVPSGVYGQYSYAGQPWRPLEECCSGCRDLAFTVCAEPCKVLLDNGGPDLTRFSKSLSGAPIIVEARTADDFVVPPCADQQLCYVQGYLATNCNPPRARLDVYDAACGLPATFSPPITFPASRITDTGQTVRIEGVDLRVYSVEFWDFRVFGPEPLTLQAGLNYWMSIYAVSSGSIDERGYVLGARRCDIPNCGGPLQRFNPAAVSGLGFGITDHTWRTVDPIGGSTFDVGFLVAVHAPAMQPGIGAQPACRADFDLDGRLSIDDIFAYLGQWFAGCP
jgi:hypothetical protein